jgi:hypothetical protein
MSTPKSGYHGDDGDVQVDPVLDMEKREEKGNGSKSEGKGIR